MDNYYEYLRTFSQELGARIVEMYPPLQEPNDPLPTALETLLRQPLDHRSLDRRQLFGFVRCLPNDNFRIGGHPGIGGGEGHSYIVSR